MRNENSRLTRPWHTLARAVRAMLAVGLAAALTLVLAGEVHAAVPAAPTVTGHVGVVLPDVLTVDTAGLVDPVTWSISPPLPAGLAIDIGTSTATGSGVISGTPTGATPAVNYSITATDSTAGTPLVRTAEVSVAIDGDLVAPDPVTATLGRVLEGSPSFEAHGMTAPLSFNAPAAPGWLHISATGGLSGIPDATLSETAVPVSVTDANGAIGNATLTLSVVGSLTPATQSLTGTVGVPLSAPTAAFPSSPSTAYAVSPDITALTGLAFDSGTGIVSGTPTGAIPPTQFVVTQHATPGSEVQAQATIGVTVDATLGTSAVPVTGIVGTAITPITPYAASAASAVGLTGPFTFSTVPALPGEFTPSDLVINRTTGVISGRPSSAVVGADYTVVVTDTFGTHALGRIAVTIAGSLLPVTQSLNGAVASSILSRSLSAVGMTAPVQYAITPALPAGLQFNAATGVISGIPRATQASTVYSLAAKDANGATASAKLTLTIGKALLFAPVIGSVVGGAEAGSLVVTFTAPRTAPVGQTYTVEVYDAMGAELVTSVDAKSSPVTVLGLTPGDDYQVVVVANATSSYDRVESLPKLGTASLVTTVSTTTLTSAHAATVATATSKPDAVTLRRAGVVLASPTQAARAKRVVLKAPASRLATGAPVVRLTARRFTRLVVSVAPLSGVLQVRLRVNGVWLVLGTVRVNARQRVSVPAFAIRAAGRYSLLFAGSTGTPSYVTLAVGP